MVPGLYSCVGNIDWFSTLAACTVSLGKWRGSLQKGAPRLLPDQFHGFIGLVFWLCPGFLDYCDHFDLFFSSLVLECSIALTLYYAPNILPSAWLSLSMLPSTVFFIWLLELFIFNVSIFFHRKYQFPCWLFQIGCWFSHPLWWFFPSVLLTFLSSLLLFYSFFPLLRTLASVFFINKCAF